MKCKQIHLQRRRILKFMLASGVLTQAPLTLANVSKQTLILKKIPSSGEKIPVIGLGTSRVFEVGTNPAARQGPAEVLKILAGISNSMMDTSPMYGSAETVVGDLSDQQKLRDQLFFATKVWTEGKRAGIAQMQESMRRLKTDHLELMQIHNLVDWRTHIKTLRDWKDKGIIRYLGITHYNAGAHEAVMDIMRREPLDFLQINYSLFEPEADQAVLPLAQDKNVAVIINRPFARGALFRRTKGKPLPDWAVDFDCQSWAQLFLKFVVSHPAVTCTIPGTSKPKHMLDNQQAGYGRLPDTNERNKIQQYMRSI